MLSKAQEAALQAIRYCVADINEYYRLGGSADCELTNNVIEIIKDHFGIKQGESIPDGPLKEVIVELFDDLMKNKFSRIASANLAKKYSL